MGMHNIRSTHLYLFLSFFSLFIFSSAAVAISAAKAALAVSITALGVAVALYLPPLAEYSALCFATEADIWAGTIALRNPNTLLLDYTINTQVVTHTFPAVPASSNPQVQQLATTVQSALGGTVSNIEAAVTAARRYQGAVSQGNPVCGISPLSKISPSAAGTPCAQLRQQEVVQFVLQAEQSAAVAVTALRQLSQLAPTTLIQKNDLLAVWNQVTTTGQLPAGELPYFAALNFNSPQDLQSVVDEYAALSASDFPSSISLSSAFTQIADAIERREVLDVRSALVGIVPGLEIYTNTDIPTMPEWAVIIMATLLMGLAIRAQARNRV